MEEIELDDFCLSYMVLSIYYEWLSQFFLRANNLQKEIFFDKEWVPVMIPKSESNLV